MTRPLAYITGDFWAKEYVAEVEAADYCKTVFDAGYNPICPILFQNYFLDTTIPEIYAASREMSLDMLRRSRIVIVCGPTRPDETLADIALAKRLRIPVVTLEGILKLDKATPKRK